MGIEFSSPRTICGRCGEAHDASARHECVRFCACCEKPIRGRYVESDGRVFHSYSELWRWERRQGAA